MFWRLLFISILVYFQVYEVVRPLVSLLNTEKDGMQNYEALLGLTNLAGKSDKLRLVLCSHNKY